MDLAGRSPGPSAQSRPPKEERLCRARDPLRATVGPALPPESAHAGARRACAGGRGAARTQAAERPPAGGAPRPAGQSRGAGSAERRAGDTNTKRKGNQPALTCKQGLPSGGARSDRPRKHTPLHPDPSQPIHLPAPGPSRRGPDLVAAATPAPVAFGLR